MSQNVLPGSLAGTIRDTKGRVSRLERELAAVRRGVSDGVGEWKNRIVVPGTTLPLEDNMLYHISIVWLPHDATLVGISIATNSMDKPEAFVGLLAYPAWLSQPSYEHILQYLDGQQMDGTRTIQGVAVAPFRIDVKPKFVPALVPVVVGVSLDYEDEGSVLLRAIFEFDIGPRQPSA
jgi:hypothetical protein